MNVEVSCNEKTAGSDSEQSQVNENIVAGDSVVCKEVRETIIYDPEFGADNMMERICEGTVTKIEEGKVYIKIDNIADRYYVKNLSSWVIDESVRKPPPFSKGGIYECIVRKEELKTSFSLTKINVIITKKSGK